MTSTLRVAGTKDVHTLIFEMDDPIGEASRFGNALALAIEGVGKMTDMEQRTKWRPCARWPVKLAAPSQNLGSNGKSYSNSHRASEVR
jgi:hypothetical protein